jgi:oligopeptide/dipeptide ABC transporter ATP-binding protein
VQVPEVVLDVRDLRTRFATRLGDVEAVSDVSFHIERGETVALVGESGSGKSVTALSILGLLESTGRIAAGSIEFNGRQLVGLPERQLRAIRGREIAMIFQDPATCLDPVYTVENQLVEALSIHQRISGTAARARAVELLKLVRMPDPEARMKSYQHQLSGGQRQRVMIAMALAMDPELLIADEPTTALDVTVQAQILDLLRGLQERTGTAILFVTHDLGVVAQVADRVVVMYAGRVVEEGSVRAVLKDPRNPYTQALLESMPGRVAGTGERLTPIEGVVPNLFAMPAGCRYAPRCPHAFDRCREESPPLLPVSGSRSSRCWLHDSGQLAGARS